MIRRRLTASGGVSGEWVKFDEILPLPKKIKGVRWKPAESPNNNTRQFTYINHDGYEYFTYNMLYSVSGPSHTFRLQLYKHDSEENLAYFYYLKSSYEKNGRIYDTEVYNMAVLVDGYWTLMEDDVVERLKQMYGETATVYENNWQLTGGSQSSTLKLLSMFGLDLWFYVVD